jgi:hypothetical protein
MFETDEPTVVATQVRLGLIIKLKWGMSKHNHDMMKWGTSKSSLVWSKQN